MKKYFDIEIDGQVELENGKTLGELKESNISITNPDEENSGSGETKNFYLFEFDDTDQAYYVKNITTGEEDEDYGGAVSQQLLEEFNKDRYDVMSRVLTTLGPAGGVTAQYKPIGVTIYGGTPKFVFYAYGSSRPINTTAIWSGGRWI